MWVRLCQCLTFKWELAWVMWNLSMPVTIGKLSVGFFPVHIKACVRLLCAPCVINIVFEKRGPKGGNCRLSCQWLPRLDRGLFIWGIPWLIHRHSMCNGEVIFVVLHISVKNSYVFIAQFLVHFDRLLIEFLILHAALFFCQFFYVQVFVPSHFILGTLFLLS